MLIVKGKYLGEESYKKGDFLVRNLGIKEDNKILPRLVQVKPDYINNFKLNDEVSIEVYASAYDVNSKKYLASNVKFAMVSASPKQ